MSCSLNVLKGGYTGIIWRITIPVTWGILGVEIMVNIRGARC